MLLIRHVYISYIGHSFNCKSTIMKEVLMFAVGLILSVSGKAADNLAPWQKTAIVTRFASEVKYNYAGYGNLGFDYDSLCRAELPSLVDTGSDEEFSDKLVLFANRLKDGHTGISYSADVTSAPILQKRIGDKVYVTDVFSDEYSSKGIARGTELVAVDGIPVIDYGRRYVAPFIPSSTSQWSEYYTFNSINLTKGYRGVPVRLTFRNHGGDTFDVVDQRRSPWGTVAPDMSITFDTLPGNIGILKIPSFKSDNFDAAAFYDLYEKKIMPTAGLIVDIRDNGGGNSSVGMMIMRLLATDSIPQAAWSTPQYEAAYASWGRKWRTMSVDSDTLIPYNMYDDDTPVYDKSVVLLVNSATFSAAEDFAVLFRNSRRGKIIGTPTGGSTGNPIVIDLGWGYYGRICTRHERLADGTEFIGVGIQPDVSVEETESVIFGDDNVIRVALDELSR